MKFDVIIVNYCSHQPLKQSLSSLLRYNEPNLSKVYVIDNSPDGVPKSIKTAFPTVIFQENFKNLGFAKGVNQALNLSKAPYICLLNPDTEIKGPLLQQFHSFFQKHPRAGVVGPLILESDGSVQGSARSFPRIATAFFGRTTLLSRLLPNNPISKKEVIKDFHGKEPIKVDWVSGACMGIRSEAVKDVGLLDERFFLYWEDCDWCTRFRQKGWDVFYLPTAGPVVHHTGLASKHAKWLSNYHFHRSAWLLYNKYDTSPGKIMSMIALAGAFLRFSMVSLKLMGR